MSEVKPVKTPNESSPRSMLSVRERVENECLREHHDIEEFAAIEWCKRCGAIGFEGVGFKLPASTKELGRS